MHKFLFIGSGAESAHRQFLAQQFAATWNSLREQLNAFSMIFLTFLVGEKVKWFVYVSLVRVYLVS